MKTIRIRMRTAAILAAGALLLGCAAAPPPETRVHGAASTVSPTGTSAAPDAYPVASPAAADRARIDPRLEARVFVLVNREREARGVSPVKLSGDLIRIARSHALDMANRGYFSHYTPEGLGPGDRARRGGVRYGAFAENLARVRNGRAPADLAIRAWLKSPGHRRNLLDEGRVGYRYTGVGVAVAPDGTVLLSQVFLR